MSSAYQQAARPRPPSPFSTLPAALLARVLQHVPQQQRLACCALVSREWAAAAAAGTTSIDHSFGQASKNKAVGAWIQKHGRQLKSMQLDEKLHTTRGKPPLKLPCDKLQQLTCLQLMGLEVRPVSGEGTTTSSSSMPSWHMPKLQDLCLEHCVFESVPALLQLGPFTGATQLRLNLLGFRMPQDPGSPAAPEASQARSLSAAAAALGVLQHMTQLQRLQLNQDLDGQAWAAAALPPSITALDLNFRSWGGRVSLPSSLQQLGALQELSLHCGGFCPAVLASLPQLLELQLEWCRLLPDAAGMDGATLLLGAVGRMQQLRRLALEESSAFTAALPSSCSALTASSHLTHLDITCSDLRSLPRGAVQHMFPAGRLWPQLQELYISYTCPDADDIHFMTGAELAGVIRACPALTSLGIAGALQPGDSCDALLQLPPTCDWLSIGGEAFGDSAAATVVQLTQVTKFEWIGSQSLTDAGLYQLTALQRLRALRLDYDNGLSGELVDKDEDGLMVNSGRCWSWMTAIPSGSSCKTRYEPVPAMLCGLRCWSNSNSRSSVCSKQMHSCSRRTSCCGSRVMMKCWE